MRFSKIKDNDIANGVGITMSLWTQGCPHHCKGCFNVETWDFNGGKEFTNSDLKYILDNINKNNIDKNICATKVITSLLITEFFAIKSVEYVSPLMSYVSFPRTAPSVIGADKFSFSSIE